MRRGYIFAAILAFILPVGAQAQLKISYFVDRSLQRSSLNPAFSPESNYFHIPVASGVEVGEYGNLSLSDLLYPKNGHLYTFLNSNVSTQEVMQNLDSDIASRTQVSTQILGMGTHIGESLYLTMGVDVRADINMKLPKDMFIALKQGATAEDGAVSFSYKGAAADVLTLAQLTAGLKVDMSAYVPGFSFGVRAKYAVIAAAVQAQIDKGEVYMGSDSWNIRTEGSGYYAAQGLKYTAEKGVYRVGKLGTAGGGILFDLGFDYTLDLPSDAFSSISLSASMLDFGSLTYKGGAMNPYNISGDKSYEGVRELDFSDNVVNQISRTLHELSQLAELSESQTKDNLLYKLTPTVYAGAQFSFWKDRFSTGLLYSKTSFNRDFTMSANLKLAAFNLAASYSFVAAKSFGCYLGIIPKKGLAVFVGSDYIPTRFTPQYIPIDEMNINFRGGLSFVF